MKPLKPYLIRATYEWIVDNAFTPYLLVDATVPGAVVPMSFVEGGRIILNLRPEAIQGLIMGNDALSFSARFGGKPMRVEAPIRAVLALYAQENGRGMVFDDEEGDGGAPSDPPEAPEPPTPPKSEPRGRPVLKVVK